MLLLPPGSKKRQNQPPSRKSLSQNLASCLGPTSPAFVLLLRPASKKSKLGSIADNMKEAIQGALPVAAVSGASIKVAQMVGGSTDSVGLATLAAAGTAAATAYVGSKMMSPAKGHRGKRDKGSTQAPKVKAKAKTAPRPPTPEIQVVPSKKVFINEHDGHYIVVDAKGQDMLGVAVSHDTGFFHRMDENGFIDQTKMRRSDSRLYKAKHRDLFAVIE